MYKQLYFVQYVDKITHTVERGVAVLDFDTLEKEFEEKLHAYELDDYASLFNEFDVDAKVESDEGVLSIETITVFEEK